MECRAPLGKIPLFVRAGAILPCSDPVSYAEERGGEVSVLEVYAGSDGSLTLYNDEGDGYGFEQGIYSSVELSYNDTSRALCFGKAEGRFPAQNRFNVHFITGEGEFSQLSVDYCGEPLTVSLTD